jgi:hypothetical protein
MVMGFGLLPIMFELECCLFVGNTPRHIVIESG